MRWPYLILIILVFVSKHTSALENKNLDSLIFSVEEMKADTNKVIVLNMIADRLLYVDYEDIRGFAEDALSLSEELDYEKGIARAYNNLGIFYREVGVYDQAIDYFFKSLKIMEEVDNQAGIARSYNLIGIIYYYLTSYDLSLEYYNKALEINKMQDDVKWIAGNYNNVGMIYKEKGEYEKALMYYNRSLQMSQVQNNQNWIANNYGNIGNLFLQMGKPEAIDYLEKRLRIKIEQSDSSGIASANHSIGAYYNQFEKYVEALPYLQKSYDIAKRKSLRSLSRDAVGALSETYEKLGDYKNAYCYFLLFNAINDSLKIIDNSQKITRLKMQHDYIIKGQLAEVEYQKTEIYYFAIGGILFVVLLIIMLSYGKQRVKSQQHVLERERLELEKVSLQEDLDIKNTELQENVKYLVAKNEMISEVTKKLVDEKPNFTAVNKRVINEIILELQLSIDSDVWQDFELRFNQIHSDFYTQLNNRFPTLTPNEKKLCAFLRLNMSSREVSAITNQSIKSIETARTRLRKKLGLSNQKITLSEFISGF